MSSLLLYTHTATQRSGLQKVNTMLVITTKVIQATDKHGVRVKATSAQGKYTMLNWDPTVEETSNHVAAAQALAKKLGCIPDFYYGGFTHTGTRFFQFHLQKS